MNKCLVFFAKGENEILLLRRISEHIIKNHRDKLSDIKIEYYNINQLDGVERAIYRKFDAVKNNYGEYYEFIVILLRDSDEFEFKLNPSIDWAKIREVLINDGAKDFVELKAKVSTDDWLLKDPIGLLNYLQLSSDILTFTQNIDLKSLFKKANKHYIKGTYNQGLVDHLDINKIVEELSSELLPLYTVMSIQT